jgi:hypothetical protein
MEAQDPVFASSERESEFHEALESYLSDYRLEMKAYNERAKNPHSPVLRRLVEWFTGKESGAGRVAKVGTRFSASSTR